MKGGIKIKCPRCGNESIDLFSFNKNKLYCRACCSFLGKTSNLKSNIRPVIVRANIDYKLSFEQSKIAKKILDEEETIYVKAVCGAGKTECVFPSIEKALQEGKRVGFAIPRKEVVIEIYERLKEVFKGVNICAVYGGSTKILDGEIIVFTTHQSYRFEKAFGLLIIDEYDAFPFKGNKVLNMLTTNTCEGKKVYLSATFLDEKIIDKKHVKLDKRYHHVSIPSPSLVITKRIFQYIKILNYCKKIKDDKSVFVFVPTIKDGLKMYRFLRLFLKNIIFINSKEKDKKNLFILIKRKVYKIVITTSILERGITLYNLDVLIFCADHRVFDFRTLIQIVGRVGRKKTSPFGSVIFYASKRSKDIQIAIQEIDKSNGVK